MERRHVVGAGLVAAVMALAILAAASGYGARDAAKVIGIDCQAREGLPCRLVDR